MRDFLLNWVLTASMLTAAVLLLRAVFGRRISARLRYALWVVALARLLIPGQFYTAPVEAPRVLPEIRTIQTLPAGSNAPETTPGGEADSPARATPAPAGEEETSPARLARTPVNPLALLGGVWLAGSMAMAAAFLLSNRSFSRKLRRVRTPLEGLDSPLPVYAAPGLPSPCLFGVFHPAVYVTPEAAENPSALRHVLIHETTHYRHGDHLWSLLRCGALAIHWWNPLVWLAAILSRRDAELACDEGTLKILGDGERRAYGNTLLALVTAKAQPGDLLRCATTMTGDKRSLRERVRRIAKAPKRWLWAAVVTIALAALVCACSFAKAPEKHADDPLTAEEPEEDNGLSAVPTAYPAWEPERVIPLDGLAPYGPEAVTVERRTGDPAGALSVTRFQPDGPDSFDVEVYRSADGTLRAAVAVSETERNCFLTVPDSDGWLPEDNVEVFTDLFGRRGLRISYYGQLDEHAYGEINDFYTFADDGTPSLLLRAKGSLTVADLDGDGADEVTASDGWNVSQLFFQRDGQIYMADLYALIQDAWPEAGYMTHGSWDPDGRYLSMAVELPLDGTDITVTAYRTLFFDGENLRIYKNNDPYTNHMAQGLDALPEDVTAAARDFVQEQFGALAVDSSVAWDDWRITGLSGPWYETAGDIRVEIWNVSYETHTATPERIMLAGGSYLGEDGWCMIGYPGCDYLYFQLDGDGNRTYLFSKMENDCAPGSEMFLEDLTRALEDRDWKAVVSSFQGSAQ